MPCQYCSFPQTKGEWWDWGFGLLLLWRTKWRQIIKKLWTSGNGPFGACWGHHLEMCYSSFILWTNAWLTDFSLPSFSFVCFLIRACIAKEKSEPCCFLILIHELNTNPQSRLGLHSLLSCPLGPYALAPSGKHHQWKDVSQTWRLRVKTMLHRWKWTSKHKEL